MVHFDNNFISTISLAFLRIFYDFLTFALSIQPRKASRLEFPQKTCTTRAPMLVNIYTSSQISLWPPVPHRFLMLLRWMPYTCESLLEKYCFFMLTNGDRHTKVSVVLKQVWFEAIKRKLIQSLSLSKNYTCLLNIKPTGSSKTTVDSTHQQG